MKLLYKTYGQHIYKLGSTHRVEIKIRSVGEGVKAIGSIWEKGWREICSIEATRKWGPTAEAQREELVIEMLGILIKFIDD